MPLDPQIEAMLSQMPEWPPVRAIPLDQLRESVRTSSGIRPSYPEAPLP